MMLKLIVPSYRLSRVILTLPSPISSILKVSSPSFGATPLPCPLIVLRAKLNECPAFLEGDCARLDGRTALLEGDCARLDATELSFVGGFEYPDCLLTSEYALELRDESEKLFTEDDLERPVGIMSVVPSRMTGALGMLCVCPS